MTVTRPALFRAPALVFTGDRSYVDLAGGVPLAQAVHRDQSLWQSVRTAPMIMDFRDPAGACLLAVQRVPPGFRPGAWSRVSWPDGTKVGTIRPRGLIYCDFRLQGPNGGVLAVAQRISKGFRESFRVEDEQGALLATVIEPQESVEAMGKRGALPSTRWLHVELKADLPDPLHALVLALPLVIRMRHGWDFWQY